MFMRVLPIKGSFASNIKSKMFEVRELQCFEKGCVGVMMNGNCSVLELRGLPCVQVQVRRLKKEIVKERM